MTALGAWARLCHLLAVRSARPCPECGRPIRELDAWGYLAGEIHHEACLMAKLGGLPPDRPVRVHVERPG